MWNGTFPVVPEFGSCPKVKDKDSKCSHFLKRDVRLSIWNILTEGNGTPLQYSCLENPMDGGPWWAAVRGVAKSWT